VPASNKTAPGGPPGNLKEEQMNRHQRRAAKKMSDYKCPDRRHYADDLNGFLNFIQASAETVFKINGSVAPAVIAEMKGCLPPMMIRCLDGDTKQFFFDAQAMLEENGVDRAAKVGEAWVSEYPLGTTDFTLRPSLDPNRKEMVYVVARERGGGGLSSMAYIMRPDGAPPYLASWERDMETNDGPLLGMVPTQ
jgi:hypothetical protein